MIPLGDTYKTKLGVFEVLKRQGNVVMAWHKATPTWEVFHVRLRKRDPRFHPEGEMIERPPSDEEWGTHGWSTPDSYRALQIFHREVAKSEKKTKEKAQQ